MIVAQSFADEFVQIKFARRGLEKDAFAGKLLQRAASGVKGGLKRVSGFFTKPTAASGPRMPKSRPNMRAQQFKSPYMQPKPAAPAAAAPAVAAPAKTVHQVPAPAELAKNVPGPIHAKASAPAYGRAPATTARPGLRPDEFAPMLNKRAPKNMTMMGGTQNRQVYEQLPQKARSAIEAHPLVRSGQMPRENAMQLMDWGSRGPAQSRVQSIIEQARGTAGSPAASGIRLKATRATAAGKVAVASISYDVFIQDMPRDVVDYFDARRAA